MSHFRDVEDTLVGLQQDAWREQMKGMAVEEITVSTHEATGTTLVDDGTGRNIELHKELKP